MLIPDGSDPAQSTTPNLTDPFMAFEAVANLLYTESYAVPSPLQSTAHVPFPRKTSFIWSRLYVERKCTGGAKAACTPGMYSNARQPTRRIHRRVERSVGRSRSPPFWTQSTWNLAWEKHYSNKIVKAEMEAKARLVGRVTLTRSRAYVLSLRGTCEVPASTKDSAYKRTSSYRSITLD